MWIFAPLGCHHDERRPPPAWCRRADPVSMEDRTMLDALMNWIVALLTDADDGPGDRAHGVAEPHG